VTERAIPGFVIHACDSEKECRLQKDNEAMVPRPPSTSQQKCLKAMQFGVLEASDCSVNYWSNAAYRELSTSMSALTYAL
jgi:hypothetical protein